MERKVASVPTTCSSTMNNNHVHYKKRRLDDDFDDGNNSDGEIDNNRQYRATSLFDRDEDFASKMEQIDSEYARRMYAVESWYRSEWHKAHGHAVEDSQVTRFFVSANQFTFRNGNSASSPISLMGVWDFLMKDRRIPEKMTWKIVIQYGCKLWETWKEEHYREKRHFPDVKEIIEMPQCDKQITQKMTVEKEIYGRLHNSDPTDDDPDCVLIDIVTAMSAFERCAGTFTARQTTMSLYWSNHEYWIFDSHGGDKPGASTLLKITDSEKFVKWLQEKFPPIHNIYGSPHDINNFLFLLFVTKHRTK